MIIIRYCNNCKGKPYYNLENDSTHYFCPFCQQKLKKEVYYDEKLLYRNHIPMEQYSELRDSIIDDGNECTNNTIKEHAIQSADKRQKEYPNQSVADRENQLYSKHISTEQYVEMKENTFNDSDECENKTIKMVGDLIETDKHQASQSIEIIEQKEESDRAHKFRRQPREIINSINVEGREGVSETEESITQEVELKRNNEEVRMNENAHRIQGKIKSVRTDSNYHRTFMQQIWEKIRFGQRISDIENTVRIVLITDEGYEKINNGIRQEAIIVIHGAIRGGLDNSLSESKIVAEGRYSDRKSNEFIARNIYIDGSNKQIEVENGDVLIIAIPLMIIALLFYLFTLIPDGMSISEAIIYAKNRIFTFLSIDLILSAISASLIYFRTRRRLMQVVRGMRPLRFRTCLATGIAISTFLSVIIMFVI